MSERTKKDLMFLSLGLFIMFAGCFIILDIIIEDGAKDQDMQNASFKEKAKIFISIDGCLDDGGCWDYIRNRCEMHDQGYCEKDEQDCTNRNGIWQEDKKYCILKD